MKSLEQIWKVRQYHKGKVVYEETKKNIIVDEGEKAFVDVFYRGNSSLYFAATPLFYVGLYQGSVSEATVLTTIPNEPTTGAYVRQSIARSTAGWPTIEKHENDWRVVSTQVTFTATGGTIGPVSGAFLCTSLDNSGVLMGALSMAFERTIPAGDVIEFENVGASKGNATITIDSVTGQFQSVVLDAVSSPTVAINL